MRKTIFILCICTLGVSSILMAQAPSVSGVSTNTNKPVQVTSTPKLQVSEKIIPVVVDQPVSAGKQELPAGNIPSLSNGKPIEAPDHQQKEHPVNPQ